MINFYLFIAAFFLLTFLIGKWLEKIRVPWIFSALILGALLALQNPFQSITNSAEFIFLAQLGMYFLLFVIGFEINLSSLRQQSRFIFGATLFIILLEAFFGSLVIHFIFQTDWLVAIITALSFATVGETILMPILDEFKLINHPLGQSLIGIGVLDDIIEIFTLIMVIFMVSSGQLSSSRSSAIELIIGALFLLFLLTFGLLKSKKEKRYLKFLNPETLFLIVLALFFLFLGIGKYAHASAVAALLAGLALNNLLPKKRLASISTEIRMLSYGFFAPIFFLWVGSSINLAYLLTAPFLILLVLVVSNGVKIIASYLFAHQKLGNKTSLLLGIGLSVRFSTSIIIIKILFDHHLITAELFSILVAASALFSFIIPALFSFLLVKWKINLKKI